MQEFTVSSQTQAGVRQVLLVVVCKLWGNRRGITARKQLHMQQAVIRPIDPKSRY